MKDGKNPYEELVELLEEGRKLELRLIEIKKRLKTLSKITNLNLDLDKWVIKDE